MEATITTQKMRKTPIKTLVSEVDSNEMKLNSSFMESIALQNKQIDFELIQIPNETGSSLIKCDYKYLHA